MHPPAGSYKLRLFPVNVAIRRVGLHGDELASVGRDVNCVGGIECKQFVRRVERLLIGITDRSLDVVGQVGLLEVLLGLSVRRGELGQVTCHDRGIDGDSTNWFGTVAEQPFGDGAHGNT